VVTFSDAHKRLRELDIVLTKAPGEYHLNYRNASRTTERIAETLEDALELGQEMAESAPPAPLPPLGPTKPKNSRRAKMYQHNRIIAERRMQAGKDKKAPKDKKQTRIVEEPPIGTREAKVCRLNDMSETALKKLIKDAFERRRSSG
jgi:hypothetical protein